MEQTLGQKLGVKKKSKKTCFGIIGYHSDGTQLPCVLAFSQDRVLSYHKLGTCCHTLSVGGTVLGAVLGVVFVFCPKKIVQPMFSKT